MRRMGVLVGAAVMWPLLVSANGMVRDTANVEWGERLVRGVTPETNEYASRPTIVTWAGVGGSGETRNRSVCSSLVAHLFMQAYGYDKADFKRWMGTGFPQAQDFYAAIVAAKGFQRVGRITAIAPGDVLAVRYPPGSHPTGHVMVVVSPPRKRAATPPEMPGTQQFELLILDSSRTGHGPTDTRHYAKGRFHSGVGEGTLRLYADAGGAIAGYSWSTLKSSQIYVNAEREMVVGRLNGSVKPGGPRSPATEQGEEPAGDEEPPVL